MPATLAIKDASSAEPIEVLRSVPAFRRFVAFGCNSNQIHTKTLTEPFNSVPPRLSLNGAVLSREHKLLAAQAFRAEKG
ncbi:hypothetical protein AJ78_07214 [Emergomyces pasteurianus Ep9510]|uniref:Uncharacterized protein n=1 Tax=Emergomyces pasteurianus Ep9510 TaxID=1447872 RepID=A0A1J9Q7G4_9EURO|nr:hypothetical protein AJ78_07214 [Emergomyces pasteurianus Ep9510]